MQKIPFIFAVTGHRDLRDKDILSLRESVKRVFKEFKQKAPHTSFVLLTALAEGADMLVAEVALECGGEIDVILPYHEKEYLESFDNKDEINRYESLKAKAREVKTLECDYKKDGATCYEKLGVYLVENSTALIALWDEKVVTTTGGTAEVVKYKRQREQSSVKLKYKSLKNGEILYVIKTPRVKNPIESDFKVQKEFLGVHFDEKIFDENIQYLDLFNKEFRVSSQQDSCAKNVVEFLKDKAKYYEKRLNTFSIMMMAIIFIALVAFEAMHVLGSIGMHLSWLNFIYIIGLALSAGIYFFVIKKEDLQNRYIYARGIREALRVQNAFNHAGIKKDVSNYFLRDTSINYLWMKLLLKGINRVDKTLYEKDEINWIDSQIGYFENSIKSRDKKLEFWEKLEKTFYRIGLIALVLMSVVFFVDFFHIGVHSVKGHGVSTLTKTWHYLILLSSISFTLAAFIGEKYLKTLAYKEEIYNFALMKNFFEDAKEKLEGVEKGTQKYKETIENLGKEALNEHSKWVVLHDTRKVKWDVE